jgi:hypothetical protein
MECVSVFIGVWSVAESSKRVPPTSEGREDVCLLAVGCCRSGATSFERAGGKVRAHS